MGKKHFLLMLLVCLGAIVVIGSGTNLYLLKRWIEGGPSSLLRQGTPGQFVKPPSDHKLAENIQHTSEQMKYKQLASLYVSRMSLDDEIAQLLMVEYRYATHYSSDLDTMLNQQHVSAVIMYREQINTTEQTIQDTSKMQKRSTLPVFIAID